MKNPINSTTGATAIKATANGSRYVAERSLMITAITAKAIEQIANKVQQVAFDKAVPLRATRKDIPQEMAAIELSKQLEYSLEDKMSKLKAKVSKKSQETIVSTEETEVLWSPKIV